MKRSEEKIGCVYCDCPREDPCEELLVLPPRQSAPGIERKRESRGEESKELDASGPTQMHRSRGVNSVAGRFKVYRPEADSVGTDTTALRICNFVFFVLRVTRTRELSDAEQGGGGKNDECEGRHVCMLGHRRSQNAKRPKVVDRSAKTRIRVV